MNGEKTNILILDDEMPVLQALERSLMIAGYHPYITTDPHKACRLLSEFEICIFICDQRMPGISGNEVLQYAKEHSPDTIRILLTGYSDMDSTIAAINNELIFRYIPKPWNETDLLRILQEGIGFWKEKKSKDALIHNFTSERETWQKTIRDLNAAVGDHENGAMNALLKTVKAKDEALYNHSRRVEYFTLQTVKKLGYSSQKAKIAALSGLFHDIGKLTIQDNIVYQNGPLDDMSYDRMKEHVTFSCEIIRELGFLDCVADIVLEHHERLDGSGYPFGKTVDEISQEAKILAIADVYDALVTDRVYHKGISSSDAIKVILKDVDIKFDRRIFEVFKTVVNEVSYGEQGKNTLD